MTAPDGKTPRTDGLLSEYTIGGGHLTIGKGQLILHARQLERELAQTAQKLAECREELEKWKRDIDITWLPTVEGLQRELTAALAGDAPLLMEAAAILRESPSSPPREEQAVTNMMQVVPDTFVAVPKNAAQAELMVKLGSEYLARQSPPSAKAERDALVVQHDLWTDKYRNALAERDAAIRDAERYRWLRVENYDERQPRVASTIVGCIGHVLEGEELDAVIDAFSTAVPTTEESSK